MGSNNARDPQKRDPESGDSPPTSDGSSTPVDDVAIADGGPRDARARPERTCIVTRQTLPTDRLIRFVRAPDGSVVPDLAQRLPGRGVWVLADARTLRQAVDKKAFSRAFKAEAKATLALVDEVGNLLRKRALQALALANKSGRLVAGFEKVDAALAKGKVAVLVSATDGSDDGIGKLRQKARVVAAAGGRQPMHLTLFTSDELGLSLGRSRVIHACLEGSGVTDAVLRDCARLDQFLATG